MRRRCRSALVTALRTMAGRCADFSRLSFWHFAGVENAVFFVTFIVYDFSLLSVVWWQKYDDCSDIPNF